MPVSFQVEVEGVERLTTGLGDAAALAPIFNRRAMGRATLLVESAVKARTPRRTGRLFSSIRSRVLGAGDDIIGRVGTNVTYAEPVEFGSRPHDIVPIRARALMLPISPGAGRGGPVFGGARLSGAPRAGQQVAFFARVHHPGTKARHMFEDGLAASEAGVDAIFRAVAEELVRTAAGEG